MSTILDHLHYAATHEWLHLDKTTKIGTVGVTDHAQLELSDVVYVDLPNVGAQVKAGAAIAVIESVKAASDIYAPVSGEIVEVNGALTKSPELVNKQPYEDGWLFRLKVASPEEVSLLKTADAYRAQVGG